LILLVV